MTMCGARPRHDVIAADIVWSSPATNLWVASSNGDYAGMIEFVDGHFMARNSTGALVAECSSIPAAQAAVARHVASPLSVALSMISPLSPRAVLSRATRPGYLRQSVKPA